MMTEFLPRAMGHSRNLPSLNRLPNDPEDGPANRRYWTSPSDPEGGPGIPSDIHARHYRQKMTPPRGSDTRAVSVLLPFKSTDTSLPIGGLTPEKRIRYRSGYWEKGSDTE